MEKTYEWKTAKGAAVKMEVSSVSQKNGYCNEYTTTTNGRIIASAVI